MNSALWRTFTKVLLFLMKLLCIHPRLTGNFWSHNNKWKLLSMKKDYILYFPTEDLHHWIPVLNNKWNFYNISWFHYPRCTWCSILTCTAHNIMCLQRIKSSDLVKHNMVKRRETIYRHSLIIRIIHFIKNYTILILNVIEYAHQNALKLQKYYVCHMGVLSIEDNKRCSL